MTPTGFLERLLERIGCVGGRQDFIEDVGLGQVTAGWDEHGRPLVNLEEVPPTLHERYLDCIDESVREFLAANDISGIPFSAA